MEQKENIINSFRAGLNCAQTVLTAFAKDIKLDEKTALSISCGFGGGMGRMQETCGAVTGAFMAIGYKIKSETSENQKAKTKSYELIREFNKKFCEKHGTTSCRKLLDCDISTTEGHDYAVANKLFETKCEKYILTAIDITKELLKK
jgi:C_GCAxxG_C_C family probable redox protein